LGTATGRMSVWKLTGVPSTAEASDALQHTSKPTPSVHDILTEVAVGPIWPA
jgi:hypothetical protein